MRLRIYLLFVAVQLAIAAIRIYAPPSAVTARVRNPTCDQLAPNSEQLGPDRYSIEFQPTAKTGAVGVLASFRPDRIDSEKSPVPLLPSALLRALHSGLWAAPFRKFCLEHDCRIICERAFSGHSIARYFPSRVISALPFDVAASPCANAVAV